MRFQFALALALALAFVARPRAASAQPAPQVRVPYEVCSNTTQSELCSTLEWVNAQRRAAESGAAVAPLGTPPAVTPPPPQSAADRAREVARCIGGCNDDVGCSCRCRGQYLNPQGMCQSFGNALASTVVVVTDHERRIQALERRVNAPVGSMVTAVVRRRRASHRSRHH